jgi:AraC family transcriptional regulator of adaptative response/methylated-DNA-[protein]-cysteine methyltransferase
VSFHATARAAEEAGFRPCRRCRPDQLGPGPRAETIAALCRILATTDPTPTLEALARGAKMSPFHLHRIFKAATGLTPRAFAAAERAGRVRQALKTAPTITDAIYGAGYGSSGRFYDRAEAVLGMTPTTFRAGGEDLAIRVAVQRASLGFVLVAGTARGICAILLGDDPRALRRDLERRFPKAALSSADAELDALVARVIELVERPERPVDLPLDLRGTAFQHRVWQALRRIPAGKTASYSEIAAAIGAPRAARAVARACASNPIAIAVPCHRVIRTDGDRSGYRWGIERKIALLDRESSKRT